MLFDRRRKDFEIEEERRTLYRNVFSSPEGRKVLCDMLVRLHFFDEAVNDEERTLSNYSRRLLHDAGIWIPENATAIVDLLLQCPRRNLIEEED